MSCTDSFMLYAIIGNYNRQDYKNHRTFVTSAFWGLVMAAEPWEHFFWTPCRFISDLNSQTGPQESQYKDKRMVV